MANKRMFNLSVVDTDRFLEMPISSRLLYYELGMRADDDGFVDNWKKILMFTGLKEDDMKVLISKQFILPFESGVIVIRHWRLNNYLQKDRTKPTIYREELSKLGLDENNVYTMDTNCIHSIDKYSIDKNSIEYNNNSSIYDFLQQNGFVLTPIHYEIISQWEDNELTRYAIKQAVSNNKYNIKYVESILNSYKRENIQTLQQAIEREEQFSKNKTKDYKKKEIIPRWFDKDLRIEEDIDDETRKLIEEIEGTSTNNS